MDESALHYVSSEAKKKIAEQCDSCGEGEGESEVEPEVEPEQEEKEIRAPGDLYASVIYVSFASFTKVL